MFLHQDDEFGSLSLLANTLVGVGKHMLQQVNFVCLRLKKFYLQETVQVITEMLHQNSFTIIFLRSQITWFIEYFIIKLSVIYIPAFFNEDLEGPNAFFILYNTHKTFTQERPFLSILLKIQASIYLLEIMQSPLTPTAQTLTCGPKSGILATTCSSCSTFIL